MTTARFVFALSLATSIVFGNAHAQVTALSEASCPAVNDDGSRVRLPSPAIPNVTNNAEDGEPAHQSITAQALEVVGFFESGGGDPYSMVSALDQISVGYLQWNWGTHSLVNALIAGTPPAVIERAAEPLRDDLIVLKAIADGKRSASEGDAIINDWTSPRDDDPLVRGVRSSIRTALSDWLGLPEMRSVQDVLIRPKLRLAAAYARKWSEQSDAPLDDDDLALLITVMFDQIVYNGGRRGLWRDHAVALRQEFESNAAVVSFVADWVDSCTHYRANGVRDQRLYNVTETSANAELWRAAIAADPDAFSDLQTELLLYAYIRATRSLGDNSPNGFPGVFQADVFMRAATPAMGIGTVRGRDIEDVLGGN